MNKIKIAISLMVAGGVGWLVASIPIPWYHQAPFFMEPKDVVHVTSGPLAGQILSPEAYAEIHKKLHEEVDDVFKPLNWDYVKEHYDQERPNLFVTLPTPGDYAAPVRAGDTVVKDQVLAIMEDGQANQYRDELSAILQQYISQIKKAENHGRSEGELQRDMSTQIEREVATLIKLRHRMTELVRLLRSRVIYAPSSGTIVAPNRVPEPQRDEINKTKLNRWHGTPLDPENSGCFVDAGEELMSIAPTDDLHAVMYIDQSDREDFIDDMEVELKLDELPHLSYVAPLTLMSRRGEKVAPESLTTKYGGTLATRPDDKGQEALTSTAFRATVDMHFIHEDSKNDAPLIKPGMRGKARILIDDRTAWQWLVRYLFETFRFRL